MLKATEDLRYFSNYETPPLDFVTFSGDEVFLGKNRLVLAQIVRGSQRDAMANRSSKDARFLRSEGPRGSSLTDARLVLITAIAAWPAACASNAPTFRSVARCSD